MILATGTTAAALAAALAWAAPALATTSAPALPTGDALFAINCQASGNPSVWSVLETGAATPLGSDTSVNCSAGGAYDAVSKSFYFIESRNGFYLDKFNPATGVVTRGPMMGGEMYEPHQLVITNSGQAYVVGLGNGAFFDHLDLTTGYMNRIGTTNTNLATVAYNPVNDTIYGFNGGENNGNVYTVDPATGQATNVRSNVNYATGFLPSPDNATPSGGTVNGATFDSNGIAWMRMNGSNPAAASIEAYNPVTNESWAMGTLSDATGRVSTTAPHYWQSNTFIIGKFERPVSAGAPSLGLAMTGWDSLTADSLAAIAVMIIFAGTAAAFVSRRSERS